jgi:hypothetical protein
VPTLYPYTVAGLKLEVERNVIDQVSGVFIPDTIGGQYFRREKTLAERLVRHNATDGYDHVAILNKLRSRCEWELADGASGMDLFSMEKWSQGIFKRWEELSGPLLTATCGEQYIQHESQVRGRPFCWVTTLICLHIQRMNLYSGLLMGLEKSRLTPSVMTRRAAEELLQQATRAFNEGMEMLSIFLRTARTFDTQRRPLRIETCNLACASSLDQVVVTFRR